MDANTPFDRDQRRIRRERAAHAPDSDRYLIRLGADELVDRLASVKRTFVDALDLGCGDGYLANRLREQGMKVINADCGATFAGGGVQCDEDQLPFGDRQFDLVTSVGVLDTVNDLPGALTLIRRVLRPDGLFLGAFAGAGSLPRLRHAMFAADEVEGANASRIHPQIDVRAAGDLLTRAGFTLPVVDKQSVPVRFGGMLRLVHDLRAMGASNILAGRSRKPITRHGLAAAEVAFRSSAQADDKVTETFEILYLTGWSPSPDQPKPARRGSATQSLADILRPKDSN